MIVIVLLCNTVRYRVFIPTPTLSYFIPSFPLSYLSLSISPHHPPSHLYLYFIPTEVTPLLSIIILYAGVVPSCLSPPAVIV